MHDSVYTWVASRVAAHNLAHLDTLEVGSLNVNGTVRGLFTGKYLATDMRDGPGVDLVINAHNLGDLDERFAVAVCCEMLEHDDYFWWTLKELWHVLRTDGHLLLTTRGIGFQLHEYPSDYWRFTKEAIRMLAERNGFSVLALEDDPQVSGVFLHAVKT